MMKTELQTVSRSFSVFLFSVLVVDFSAASMFRKRSIREMSVGIMGYDTNTPKSESVPICPWYSRGSCSV